MNPDMTVSTAKFEADAGNSFYDWQYLARCKIEHIEYGAGTVIKVVKDPSIVLTIRFDNTSLFTDDQDFTIINFSKLFKSITMPKGKYDHMNHRLKEREASKERKIQKAKEQFNSNNQTLPPGSEYDTKSVQIATPNNTGQQVKSSTVKIPESNQNVKCPYCQWNDNRDKLPTHINFIHPKKYPAWSRANHTNHKPDHRPKEKVRNPYRQQLDPHHVICPICNNFMSTGIYPKHLNINHPGKTINTHPPLPVYIEALTTVTSIRRASGGVIQPTGMKTLNVGRRSRGYIKRK